MDVLGELVKALDHVSDKHNGNLRNNDIWNKFSVRGRLEHLCEHDDVMTTKMLELIEKGRHTLDSHEVLCNTNGNHHNIQT